MWTIIKFILWLFRYRYASGTITAVMSGTKTITVVTEFTPKAVWLNFGETEGVPVCGGCIDHIDYRIIPGGFVLIVNLSSEYRSITWVASGHNKHCGG